MTSRSDTGEMWVTWARYHQLTLRLAQMIRETAWHPNAVVCLARGGMVVGDAMSRLFRCPLGVVFTSSYEDDRRRGEVRMGASIASAAPLPEGRWLLVDDLVDSGDTLLCATSWVKENYAQATQVRTAVIWAKDNTTITPDYKADVVPASTWIVQPFEQYDTAWDGQHK